jgi:pSer/pThr/pTyr-binding forkhead associated (FHA) protein
MMDAAKFIVKAGGEINKSFEIIKDKSVIGRDPNSDIVIDDIEVSRKHLTITRVGKTFKIEDKNSTNGTFLNGKKLKKPADIKNGDLISLGQNHVLEFVYEKTDEIPESSQLGEVDQSMVTQVEEETAEVEKPIKERAPKVKPDRTNKKDRKKKTSSQKSGDKKKPTWFIILIAALAFIVIFCVIPLIVIEVTNQWCNLFAGFFNSMSPGVCP